MKKILCSIIAITVVMMMTCTVAFAAEINSSKDGTKLTVTVTGLTAGEESTLLAVDAGTALADVANDTTKIYYIDQVTATDGTATYTFDVENAGDIDIYSGYATMAADDKPLSIIAQEPVDPPMPPTGDYTLGDVNKDDNVTIADAGLVVDNFLNGTEFLISGTTDVYELGAKAADVNKDESVTIADAGLIVDYFLNGTPFPEN